MNRDGLPVVHWPIGYPILDVTDMPSSRILAPIRKARITQVLSALLGEPFPRVDVGVQVEDVLGVPFLL